ncbi:hypothetical protein KRR40_33070 [Niabella defluvii]|nr:hypothetical protein KRR40_33070 [Niabella sp. I65]
MLSTIKTGEERQAATGGYYDYRNCVFPYIMFFNGGFYSYLQKVASYFSVPVFTIMLVGLVTRKVPAIAAKAGLFFLWPLISLRKQLSIPASIIFMFWPCFL